MIRLKDIAARGGVSIMTVSKVMRNARDISAATKTRIRKLADEMGYVPNSTAQGLRNQKTRLLGLIISATTNPVYARMVMSLEEQAHEAGYNLILAHSLNQLEREETVIRQLMSRRVDGLFISPVNRMEPQAPIFQDLLEREIPTVVLGPLAPFCDFFVNVESDDHSGSYAATQHLLELGHKRIAFFSGLAAAPDCRARFDGYTRALQDAGVDVDDRLIFKAGRTIEEGANAALQLLDEKTPVTAIQATNDLVAIGATEVLLNQGLRVPEEISVVGFGNILLSEHCRVPLTTVRQPKLRLGVAAMDLMNRLLQGESPSSKRLPAEMILRKSTAPPHSKKPGKSKRNA